MGDVSDEGLIDSKFQRKLVHLVSMSPSSRRQTLYSTTWCCPPGLDGLITLKTRTASLP